MPKFRKRPVVIEAEQWNGYPDTMSKEFGSQLIFPDDMGPPTIATLEGHMTVSKGDWIIRGVAGEFYPCKAPIFERTYEPIPERSYLESGR